ncbi:MAG: flagellar basal body-associated FliL family protein [Nitrococcus sp.]|nr:flagellar basal body-associated FliL family protein [Nitrococcus sp.]
MTLVVVLATGAATVVALYYTGYIGGDHAPTVTAANAPAGEDPPRETRKPLYLPLSPPLVVNFERQGRVGYLQAGLQLMARKQPVIDAAKRNLPMIRNSLLMSLSGQSFEQLSSREGKELLRQKALAAANSVLDRVGAPGHFEALYFTSFVMQ